ncbi:hypothetical protein [Fulvimarina sp. MAC8]|uniref:hypothetical protein n=1 Tax=Fulvimarina sp. MAC8 TaxID=3162874 RepID=UPI0032EFB9DE
MSERTATMGEIVRTVKVEDLPDDVRPHFKPGSAVTTIYEGLIDATSETKRRSANLTPEEIEAQRAREAIWASARKWARRARRL